MACKGWLLRRQKAGICMRVLLVMSKIRGKEAGEEEKSSGKITVGSRGRSKLFGVLLTCLQNDCTTREG